MDLRLGCLIASLKRCATHNRGLADHCFIYDLQAFIDNDEGLAQQLLIGAQLRVGEEVVPSDKSVKFVTIKERSRAATPPTRR